MFETLDTMISLGVIFLILSMVNKYIISMVKRIFKIKAKTIAKEMETLVGENTTKYLIPYLEKKAKHLNFLEDVKETNVLRKLSKKQLEEVVGELKGFLNGNDAETIIKTLGLTISVDDVKEKKDEIEQHLKGLRTKIETMYDNTMQKISEVYETKLRYRTLISGLALAFIINANFFEIYSSLSNNSLAREKFVAQAGVINSQMKTVIKQIEQKPEVIANIKKETDVAIEYISNLTNQIENGGIQLGWSIQKFKQIYLEAKHRAEDVKNICLLWLKVICLMFLDVLSKLIGLCIAGLLISFGAPFWHDFIGTFTGLRKTLTGKKEDKKDK